ncbi:hypothetical protein [Allomuricauda sp. d1]|uniref:hypothetical protein n=1 Tax=Allomuricauda sp. d1 TaxID=3136725 RepID=UPI0031D9E9C0
MKALKNFEFHKSKTDLVGSIISFLGSLFGEFALSKPTTNKNLLEFKYKGQKKCYHLHECNLEEISQLVNFVSKRIS